MTDFMNEDDPVSAALAGGAEPFVTPAVAPPSGAPEIVDLEQFVTRVGEGPSRPSGFTGAADGPPDDEPVVSYDEARGAREYVLLHPPTVNGVRLDRVTVRLPEQADIDDAISGALSGNRAVICRLTGLHPAVFKRLKWVDAEALHQIYRDICPGFVTGEG